MRQLFAALALAFVPCLFAAEKSHLDFRAEARAAYERNDYAAARAATLAALALRPDSPRYLHNLAALAAKADDKARAIAYLNQLADLGIATKVERDPDLAPLQGTLEFNRVLARLAENAAPVGEAEVVAELPGRTGILEGIAFRERTGDLFLGDVHHRCIWRRDRDGRITRFSAEDDELLGIFGLAIDEPRQTLWAATRALPEMSGFTTEMKGEAALAEFSLVTSELRRIVPIPSDGREHGIGDLIVAPDGTVYTTDSASPIIWRLAPGAEDPEILVDSPMFKSLQGLALAERTLVVADYSNGLFAIDLASSAITPLAPPKNSTLLGIDGIVPVAGGLIAVQNGVEPQRVIRLTFAPDLASITGVTVLAQALPNLTDLTLVTLINGRPTVIAGAGWDIFDASKAKQPPAHTVRVFQVALP